MVTEREVEQMIRHIDAFLESSGRPYLAPPEANALLDSAGLLRDRASRPGQPLRRPLRAGWFPRAYQPSGKGGRWIIPHSSATGATRTRSRWTLLRAHRTIRACDSQATSHRPQTSAAWDHRSGTSWVGEKILSASEHIPKGRPAGCPCTN